MDWKNNREDHAKIWSSVLRKTLSLLGKEELSMKNLAFAHFHENLLEFVQPDEDTYYSFFVTWLIPSAQVDGKPLIDWVIRRYENTFTSEEREVLLASKKCCMGTFRVIEHNDDFLKIEDPHGKTFLVETVYCSKLEPRQTFISGIVSKGNGRYFIPARMAFLQNDALFEAQKKYAEFKDSWSGLLKGFFDHLVSQGLSEKTADRHTENVDLLMFYLEQKPGVTSFADVTKGMLNTEFRKCVRRRVLNRVDFDKAYYSFYLFFNYLAEKKNVENRRILDWLRNR